MKKRTAGILATATSLLLTGYVAWCSRAYYLRPQMPDLSKVPPEVAALAPAALDSAGMIEPSEFVFRRWLEQLSLPHESRAVLMVVERPRGDVVMLWRSDGKGFRLVFIHEAGVWRQVGEKEFEAFWARGTIGQ